MNASLFDSKNLSSQRVNVFDFLDDVIKVWSQEHPQANISNRVSSELSLRLPIFNFTQIILFLMDNSNEAKKDTCRIDISSTVEEGFICVSFSDSGVGFSHEVLKRLGEPFNSDKEQGVGLGLFSTDLFMTSLGGHMSVSNLKIGACIKLNFPKALRGELNQEISGVEI